MAAKIENKAVEAAVKGFFVDSKPREVKFGTAMTFGKMKLLSLICSPTIDRRPNPLAGPAMAEMGGKVGQKLNWEYGGWSPEMVAKAHAVISKYAPQLPPRKSSSADYQGEVYGRRR